MVVRRNGHHVRDQPQRGVPGRGRSGWRSPDLVRQCFRARGADHGCADDQYAGAADGRYQRPHDRIRHHARQAPASAERSPPADRVRFLRPGPGQGGTGGSGAPGVQPAGRRGLARRCHRVLEPLSEAGSGVAGEAGPGDRGPIDCRRSNAEARMSQGSWIDQFPGNFMWSNATLVCKGMAPYGAVAIGEIGRIAGRLAARGMGGPDVWWQEWCAMAEKNEAVADKAAAEGRDFTAGEHYLRAGNYYYTGERFVPPSDKKLDIYKKALRCSQEGLKRRHKNIEFVEVPYQGETLPAYFMKAQGAAGRAPTVVLFDGMDNCKEMSVLFAGLEFARPGMHTLAIDGPGQGEALRLRKIYARHDYEVPGTAADELVAGGAAGAPQKNGIMGDSFRGDYAPRLAPLQRRYPAR